MNLVTTPLDDHWLSDNRTQITFLGKFSIAYDNLKFVDKNFHNILPNRYDKLGRLEKDETYLKDFHENFLLILNKVLNRIYDSNYPDHYWRMLIDPWLISYLGVIYDRYCTIIEIEAAGGIKTNQLYDFDEIPSTFMDYTNFIIRDEWNHSIYIDILKFQNKFNVEIVQKEVVKIKSEKIINNRKSIKLKLMLSLNKLADKFSINNDIILYNSYLSTLDNFKLMLKMKQLPCFYNSFFDMDKYDYHCEDGNIRKEFKRRLKIEFKAKNSFEEFFANRISKDAPKYLLENFIDILTSVKKINLKPSLIASANEHWTNHIFKHWIAEQYLEGVPFITLEHGGSFPAKFDSMDYEEKVGFKKVIRGNIYRDNQITLPLKKEKQLTINKSNQFCSLIGYENPRYLYRTSALPISDQVFNHFDMVFDLHKNLDARLKNKFKIKPFPNVGWNSESIYKSEIGSKYIYKEKNIKNVFKMSKLIICTYPNTTLAQAMSSGLPTLLLYPEKLWQLEEGPNNCFKNLMNDFKKNKIAFTDVDSISVHLKMIWNDPYEWWNSELIKVVRKKFFDVTLKLDDDWISSWKAFFNENKKVNFNSGNKN